MASLNNCQFIGNVGKIETKYMPNGDAVTSISLAVNENYKNKEGDKVEKTEWVRCVMYRKLAEIAGEYVKVGSALYLSGKMQTKKYTDKAGVEKYTTEIIANEMQMLSSKSDGGQRESGEPSQDRDSNPQGRPGGSAQKTKGGDFDDFEDDIPF